MYCNIKGIYQVILIAYGAVGYKDWIRNERRLASPVHTQSTHLLLSTLPEFKYSTKYSRTQLICKFHCFTVHFDSLSFIHNNSCTFSYNYESVF